MALKDTVSDPAQRWRTYFFVLVGLLVGLYMFGDAIADQGVEVDVTMIIFLMLMAIILLTLGYLVTRMAQRNLDLKDWFIFMAAAGSVIALFWYMPGLVPSAFKGAMVETQSFMGALMGP